MTLSELNLLPLAGARAALLECCGSPEWADRLLALRPFESENNLFHGGETIWWTLDPSAWLEAFSKHPQIGARLPISAWSSGEQTGMNQASAAMAEALGNLNQTYLDRFGWIFLICATGKNADEMRAALEQRLSNPPDEEIRMAAAEQAKIIQIRLRKLVASMSGISTHVLDTSQGKPAVGVVVRLLRDGSELGASITDQNGRCVALLPAGTTLQSGIYELFFEVASYFPNGFYPEVRVTFRVHDVSSPYHVPLLINPFGFTTYRGS